MLNTTKWKLAFELIYSIEIQKIDISEYEEQIDMFLENHGVLDEKVKEYIVDVAYGVHEHQDEILKQINEELSEKWELNRLSKINIAILKSYCFW